MSLRAGAQRIEDEYRRHGMLAILAAWDVWSGRVMVYVRRRRRGRQFLDLLKGSGAGGRMAASSSFSTICRFIPLPRCAPASPLSRRVASSSWPLHRAAQSDRDLVGILERQALRAPAMRRTGSGLAASTSSHGIGTRPPAPSAGPSRAIPCIGRVGWNFWDTALGCRSSPSSEPPWRRPGGRAVRGVATARPLVSHRPTRYCVPLGAGPFHGAFEATESLLAASSPGSAARQITDGHVSVDLLTQRFSPRAQHALIATNAVLSAALLALINRDEAAGSGLLSPRARTTITAGIRSSPSSCR